MLKRELVWRQVADDVLSGHRTSFHQIELANELGTAVGNVNLALEPLRSVGAVSVVGKNLIVRDVKKILMLWSARRMPLKPIGFFTSNDSSRGMLKTLPPGIALTSFAGFILRYHEEPAPFSIIRGYVLGNDSGTLEELSRRFRRVNDINQASLVIYAADEVMARKLPNIVSPGQMFVDLWSEGDFFAADYLRALEEKLRL